jgi:hypothetical protein
MKEPRNQNLARMAGKIAAGMAAKYCASEIASSRGYFARVAVDFAKEIMERCVEEEEKDK